MLVYLAFRPSVGYLERMNRTGIPAGDFDKVIVEAGEHVTGSTEPRHPSGL